MGIRIVLVDDHQLIREGMKALLAAQPDMQVVGEAEDGMNAIRVCRDTRPDVVVMDVALPGFNGIEATREIVQASSQTKVLALTMHSKGQFVRQMLKAGAAGYLLKGCDFTEILHAIRTVSANKGYICTHLANSVIFDLIQNPDAGSELDLLTSRERQILQLIAEGKRSKEIADELLVSVKTIETYRTQIMKKLKIDSIAGLTRFALAQGLMIDKE
ncbi:MAG: DNA-binding response regulator [Myxococcales bacterium]|nr:MAG: DNA-binding response regulator [Myxococcales bacterium]